MATISSGLAEPPPLPGLPGGDSPRQQEGAVEPRVLPGLQGAGGLGTGEKATAPRPHLGCGSQPGQAPCLLTGQCTQRQRVMEETRAATGAALLLPLLHAALALAASAQPAPRSAGTLQHWGAGTQTQALCHGRDTAHCLARARPSTSWPCAQGRYRGARLLPDRCHRHCSACSAASPKPSPMSN